MEKANSEHSALCVVENLHGVVHKFIGVICYLPEEKFRVGDKVRVTVELRKRPKPWPPNQK